ncbi:MAG: type I DNA topoisomerase [Archangium sp.]
MTTLVVVESPNKIAKIEKCLGPGFRVVATVGHFRDLPERTLGIELGTWTPQYVALKGKEGVIEKLRRAVRTASTVLLATDADREGEAIAWHVAQALGLRDPRRIRFQAITPSALRAALKAPTQIDLNLVNAQQARRLLDRVVGYEISPLLSQFGPAHSAGRVQSAALHLVVERERARLAFKPTEYWMIAATYSNGMRAELAKETNSNWVPQRIATEAEAEAIKRELSSHASHVVDALQVRQAERRPLPPFTTATLQQAASAQLKLKPGQTMDLAQELFELGAITYHRTDSVSLSDEAIKMARAFLEREHPSALAPEPVHYRNSDAAQEAHEAVRPTAVTLDDIALTTAQENLFSLIARRFLASQCRPAVLEHTTVVLRAGTRRLIARGVVVKLQSFLVFLGDDEERAAERHEGTADDDNALPVLSRGESLRLKAVAVRGDQTRPPPRFTQATLVRELQRTGIGRPSTFAATVEVLFERRYVTESKLGLEPGPRGFLVDAALGVAFPDVVRADYTAAMEAQLDLVAEGALDWRGALSRWHARFATSLSNAAASLRRFTQEQRQLIESVGEAARATGKACPLCSAELQLRKGSKGSFHSCSAWPKCNYRGDPTAVASSGRCPQCSGRMEEQSGRYGRYARCLNRACTGTIDLALVTAEPCPRCAQPLKDRGEFLACSGRPSCEFTVDVAALREAKTAGTKCSRCGNWMVRRRGAKGPFLACVAFPKCRETASVGLR